MAQFQGTHTSLVTEGLGTFSAKLSPSQKFVEGQIPRLLILESGKALMKVELGGATPFQFIKAEVSK